MIFSSLFKSKPQWQHKDSTIRISAIQDELSPSIAEQHQILVTLSETDESDLVRRAALIKLNSVECFLQASKDNSAEKIRLFCDKQLLEIFAGTHALVLTTEQKNTLVSSDRLSNALLEVWLKAETDEKLIISLYQLLSIKKTNNQFLVQTFSQKQNSQVQLQLIAKVDDAKVLEKLAKKACNEEVADEIATKLDLIQKAIEAPVKLKKALQLVLSKLLALKENTEYGHYITKREELEQTWQAYFVESSVLSAAEQGEFEEKYQHILAQLTSLYAAKVEAYEQQKIADKLAFDKQQAVTTFNKQIANINHALTTAVFESDSFTDDDFDEAGFSSALAQLTRDIKDSVLSEQEQVSFIEQTSQLMNKLGQLPEIAASVSQATALISRVSQLALPENLDHLNERYQVYTQWLKDWHAIESKTQGVLPHSIKDSQQQIVSLWKTGLKSLQAEQKNLFFEHKKKLHDIKRLLSVGKYKVCFGLFKGIKQSFLLLSEKQQSQLQRDFDSVEAQLAELSDWEQYIATPRKKELLSEIEALVTTPLDNPNEQADKVKSFRKIWNSLGHAEESVDQQLNEQFNSACEQAFAPCRLFYAEQDKLRAQHFAQRNVILDETVKLAKQLSINDQNSVSEGSFDEHEHNKTIDYKWLDGQLNKLQHRWQNAGEVERSAYKKLQQQFKLATQPIKNAINDFHHGNAHAKKALIAQAELAAGQEDVFAAINEVKELQQAWRTIGFAGNNQESKLWQKFRSINDVVFAKRQQEKSAHHQLIIEKEQEFTQRLTQILSSNSSSEQLDKADILQSSTQAQALLADLISQKPVIKSLVNKVEQLIVLLASQLNDIEIAEQKQQWNSIFTLLSQLGRQQLDAESLESNVDFSSLSSYWQKRVREQALLKKAAIAQERFDKTLELEIIAQQPSPDDLRDERMAVQIKLMQNQMASGEKIELKEGFIEWLTLGALNEDDLTLLPRLENIFCK